jgi:cardiolipin synthase
VRHTHQRLLVMPDDGGQAVVDLIAATGQELLLKQFKLESAAVLESLL